MNDSFCPTCGASWRCEHAPDAAFGGLRYVPPDGPTARQIGIEAARLVGEQIGAGLLTGEEIDPNMVERALLMQQFASSIASLSTQPAAGAPSSTPRRAPPAV